MPDKINRPYGLWDSPITPESMALDKRLADVQWDSDSRTLVWLEGRSDRSVLVAQGQGGDVPYDITEADNVRARVGYGGGDFGVSRGYAYYVRADDQRLCRVALSGGAAQPITPAFGAAAAPAASPDGECVVFVHSYQGEDCLAIVRSDGRGWPQKLATGADFYMWPAWHMSSKRLAWVEWDHPNMPWDGTRLVMATLAFYDGCLPRLDDVEVLVAEEDVAVSEPRFTNGGRYLLYICDRSGYNNLYAYDLSTQEHLQITDHPAQIGGPAWAQGMRSFAPLANRQVAYIREKDGLGALWVARPDGGESWPMATPLARYTHFRQLAVSPDGKRLAAIASAPDTPSRVVSVALDGHAAERVHARSTAERVRPASLSQPQAVSWETPSGETVHGLYYPPCNPNYASSGKPPAVVMVHGGPTGGVSMAYDERAQFFATRGFGVLQVNYRGSTGHGKAYMARLRGQWGVLDVEDAVGGAGYLADSGRADPQRLVIMGGSAGGYTVWLCLAHHPGLFKAGVCLYGVANLFTLAADTHKFEERYLDSLVGPLPEAADLYRQRSPIFLADRIQDPVAVFQGDEDQVVPQDQSDVMVASLERRGIPHAYHVYEGEGHGWRRSETIQQFYSDVMAFLRQYVIFG